MKLWVDDIRDEPNDSWTCIRKVQPAIDFLVRFKNDITEISLDHDIENRPDDETFRPIAYVIGLLYQADSFFEGPVPKILIHSINPTGAKEIQAILKDYGLESTRVPYKADMDKLEKMTGEKLYGPDEDSAYIM